jgi:hypothetical protein
VYSVRFGLALLLFSTAIGCAHGRWDPTARRTCGRGVCYHVGPLPQWKLLRHDGAQLSFFSSTHRAVISTNATCRDDADATPLPTLTRHLLIGYTERRVLSEETRHLDGREALRSVVQAKLDGVPIVLDLWVLKRNGCIFDLSLAAPPDEYAMVANDFARFVSEFAQEPT